MSSMEDNKLVGRKVAKVFPGYGEQPFFGRVKHLVKVKNHVYFRIIYEDGDEEDIDRSELEAILVPKKKPGPKPGQKRKEILPQAPSLVDAHISNRKPKIVSVAAPEPKPKTRKLSKEDKNNKPQAFTAAASEFVAPSKASPGGESPSPCLAAIASARAHVSNLLEDAEKSPAEQLKPSNAVQQLDGREPTPELTLPTLSDEGQLREEHAGAWEENEEEIFESPMKQIAPLWDTHLRPYQETVEGGEHGEIEIVDLSSEEKCEEESPHPPEERKEEEREHEQAGEKEGGNIVRTVLEPLGILPLPPPPAALAATAAMKEKERSKSEPAREETVKKHVTTTVSNQEQEHEEEKEEDVALRTVVKAPREEQTAPRARTSPIPLPSAAAAGPQPVIHRRLLLGASARPGLACSGAVSYNGIMYTGDIIGSVKYVCEHPMEEDWKKASTAVLAILAELLEAAGVGKSDLLRVSVQLQDSEAGYGPFKDAWNEWLEGHPPPAVCIMESYMQAENNLVAVSAIARLP